MMKMSNPILPKYGNIAIVHIPSDETIYFGKNTKYCLYYFQKISSGIEIQSKCTFFFDGAKSAFSLFWGVEHILGNGCDVSFCSFGFVLIFL